jgi:hypothetical protein
MPGPTAKASRTALRVVIPVIAKGKQKSVTAIEMIERIEYEIWRSPNGSTCKLHSSTP